MKQRVKLLLICLMIASVVGTIFLSQQLKFQYGPSIDEAASTIEWRFFQEQFISPDEASRQFEQGQPVQLPHRWQEYLQNTKTYGTYIAKVQLPEQWLNRSLAIFVPYQYGAYHLYINEQLLIQNGKIGSDEAQFNMSMLPQMAQLQLSDDTAYIVLQLANFSSIRGGFIQPLQLGDYEAVVQQHAETTAFYYVIYVFLFIMGALLILIYLVYRNDDICLLIALMCLVLAVRSFFARPYLYTLFDYNVSWSVAVKIEAFSTALVMLLVIILCRVLASLRSTLIHQLAIVTLVSQMGLIILQPAYIFQQTFLYAFSVPVIYIFYCGYHIWQQRAHMDTVHFVQYAGILFLNIVFIRDALIVKFAMQTSLFIHFALLIHMALQILLLIYQYMYKMNEVNRLNKEVMELNRTLEQKVEERTKRIREMNEYLQTLAYEDALTGIANRHTFDAALHYYFELLQRPNQALTLYMIDLDYFKKFNDTYGHHQGDMLLKNIVTAMRTQIPPNAIFARFGGEEFAIITADTQLDGQQFGERLVAHVAQQQFHHPHTEAGVATISVGGYRMSYEQKLPSIEALIEAADILLYEAKTAGKNNCCYKNV